uniref:Uncharacterized protein n=1 Tax=Tanacetum cinerariifolium TaxID=118510 RepID=A0A6L2L1E8_TANCI|nr:hypothetical protein [Tanacetum cinerariifolium]
MDYELADIFTKALPREQFEFLLSRLAVPNNGYLFVPGHGLLHIHKMADENVPAPAPTRYDDQTLPFAAWVPIGKRNFMLDLQKTQKNPIFQISVDILQHTKFFRADALEITPIDQANQFVSPPSSDAIMDFVNELGYTEARLQGLIGLDTQFSRCFGDDASSNIVHESSSSADAEIGANSDKTTSGSDTKKLQIDENQVKDVDNQVNLEEKTTELDQGQAGSDLGKTPESRPPPEHEVIEEDQARPDLRVSRVALIGPNTKPTHKEFMATVYLDVHGSLKLPVDEHVILEEPLSSSGTLSSMKNLFRDPFLNDKSTKDEQGKLNMDSEVVSMVTVLIHQASSSVPPLSTPIIDLSPPKPVPAIKHAPIFTATTMPTTRTLPLLPPPPQ